MARKMRNWKPQGTPCQALVATTLGFSIGIAGVALFAPVAKRLKEALDLSVTQQSFLIAIPALTASLLRIPFGAAVDENGGKTLVLFLLGMAMLGLLGLCSLLNRDEDELQELSGIYWMLLGCGMLTGCGGAIFSVGAAQTAYWHPVAKQGRVLGLFGGIGNLPPGLVALGLPFALRALGMFHTYLAWLCLLILGTGYYYFFGQNAWYFQLRQNGASREEAELEAKEKYGQEIFPKGSGVQSLKMAACSIKTWALVALYFLNYGGYLALTTWLATFWMEYHGLEDVVAGLLTGLYSEGYGLTRAFIGGPVSDRVGGEAALLATFPVVGLGALMLVSTTSVSCHVAATVVMAVSMGICAAAIFKLVPVYVPEALGGAVGLVGGLGAFGSFALPPILALFVTVQGQAGYKNGFLVFCMLALLGWTIVMVLRLGRRGDDDDDDEEDTSEISSEISSDDYQESDVQDMKAGQAALPIQPRQLQVGSNPLQPNGQVPPRAASFGGWPGPMVMVVPHPAPTPRTLVQVPRSPVSNSPVHRFA